MALKEANKNGTLIIAFGNPLRQDDGVGFQAAKLLSHAPENGNMQVIFRHQLTPDLTAPISEARRVIFIDADTGPVPGSISIRNLNPAMCVSPSFVHHMTPVEILAWTNILYGRAPRADQVTVSCAAFNFKEGLTPPVQSALPILVEIINQIS